MTRDPLSLPRQQLFLLMQHTHGARRPPGPQGISCDERNATSRGVARRKRSRRATGAPAANGMHPQVVFLGWKEGVDGSTRCTRLLVLVVHHSSACL